MKVKLNLAFIIENDTTGEIEENVGADVCLNYTNPDSLGYFKEGLIALCNGMSDILINYDRE